MRHVLGILFALSLAAPTVTSAGIAQTKHDLAARDDGAGPSAGGGDRQCRFCHLTHGAETGHLGLWASAPSGRPGRDDGGARPLAGTPLDGPTGQEGPRSQRCLSCHDGTVARSIAAMVGGASSGRGGMSHGQDSPHPVSVAFPGQDATHVAPEQYGVASSTGCAAGVSLCVKDAALPAAGAHVRLFGQAGAYRVECASCHDPHQDNRTGAHPHFLRVPKTVGADSSCVGCHKK